MTGAWGAAEVRAEPVSTFLIGLGAGLAGTAGAGVYLGALGAGVAVGSFIAANIPTILLTAATLALQVIQNSQPQSRSSINVKIAAALRWYAAGYRKIGGNVLFFKFVNGALWYLIVHCDSELVEFDHYELDGIRVAINGDRRVTTKEFQGWAGGILGQFQTLQPFYTIWTSTFSPADPVPPGVAAFKAACPEWTDEHKLVGTTFSVVKIDACDDKQKQQVRSWRQGAIGVGEPSLVVVGWWSRVYDPRDEDQDPDDESTWPSSSNNAVLVSAWNRYDRHGFNRPMDSFEWDRIAAAADICDIPIEDRYGDTAPNYAASVAFGSDKVKGDRERELLRCYDGTVHYDEEGKLYFGVGHYEEDFEPVTLSRKRDIISLASADVNDGETPVDGVIAHYTDPFTGKVIPAAPWKNPAFFQDGKQPNYQVLAVEGCDNHNQAFRLAKAFGLKSQPPIRLASNIGIRIHRLVEERYVTMNFPVGDVDEDLAGLYQIDNPIEMDPSYHVGAVSMVPWGADYYTLAPGEEPEKPPIDLIELDDEVPLLDPDDVNVVSVPIVGTASNAARIEASFPEPPPNISYEFLYSDNDGETWNAMATDLQALTARSPIVDAPGTYLVVWRTVTAGGDFSEYSDPPVSITVTAYNSLDFSVAANSQYLGI